ncbi:MAG: hypothetical protein ACXAB7_14160 [Candidatus Kariarchaeaceae archaeon]|jgi:hypothetical protein
MKIKSVTKRRLEHELSKLSEKQSVDLLAQFGIEDQVSPEQTFQFINKKFINEWTTANFRKIWSAAELSHLFSRWFVIQKTKKLNISLAKLKLKLNHPDIKKERLITLEISKKPKIFFVAVLASTNKSMNDKAGTSIHERDVVYWLPEIGILLSGLHQDSYGETLRNQFEEVTGAWEDFRFISLVISKFYRENRMISQLIVNAMYQITGFQGLDEIIFRGDDVKAGLGGLHRRQDIRVHLDQVGPNIAVSSKNLDMKIGNQVRVRNIDGFEELRNIIEPSD